MAFQQTERHAGRRPAGLWIDYPGGPCLSSVEDWWHTPPLRGVLSGLHELGSHAIRWGVDISGHALYSWQSRPSAERRERTRSRATYQTEMGGRGLPPSKDSSQSGDDYQEYRSTLVAGRQESQSKYDRNLIALSSGALGISFAFIKDVLGALPENTFWLMVAWSCWTLSLTLTLGSFLSSQWAMTKAIRQVDSRDIQHVDRPGGPWRTATEWLNLGSGTVFIFGVISILRFVYLHI